MEMSIKRSSWAPAKTSPAPKGATKRAEIKAAPMPAKPHKPSTKAVQETIKQLSPEKLKALAGPPPVVAAKSKGKER